MPIYEFFCSDCETTFEVLRPKPKADDPAPCKSCNGTHTTRMLSVFAAHSNGRAVAGSGGGCGGCSPSGNCASCRSH
jgi:putative FmdB family regulatory protein